jgi:hypothetical protein
MRTYAKHRKPYIENKKESNKNWKNEDELLALNWEEKKFREMKTIKGYKDKS